MYDGYLLFTELHREQQIYFKLENYMINESDIVLINLVKIITFGWLLFWAFLAAKNLIFKQYYSIYILIIVHFVFLGLPLLLDIAIAQPTYRFTRLKTVVNDETTFWIYCIYVAIVPVIWWYMGKPRKVKQSVGLVDNNIKSSLQSSDFNLNIDYKLGKNLKLFAIIFFYFLLVLPVIVWFFSPNPSDYFTYGAKGMNLLSEAALDFHPWINISSSISLLGFTGLIVLQKTKKLSFQNFPFWLTLLIPMVISIWLNGKRHTIAYALFMLLMSLLAKGALKREKMIMFMTIVIFCFGLFSYSYQTSLVRSLEVKQLYQQSRMDFARDHLLKLSIYSELNPEKIKILDSRFKTIYHALIYVVPRFLWRSKPNAYDYKKYVASALQKKPVQDLTYGSGGIWLGEALSNFGWIGILLGPLSISLFCRTGDATNNKFITIFTSLTSLMWLILSLGAVTLFLAIWLILIVRNRSSQKSRYLKV